MRQVIVAAIVFMMVGVGLVGGQVPTTTPPEGLRVNTPTTHAFKNARLVVSPNKTIEKGTLLIRDGVVVAVGADVQIPADARVWDLNGKTVYPGIIDAYTEIAPEASRTDPALAELLGAKYWNSNITPQVRGDRIYKNDAELNKKLRSQGIVARLVAPSRGLIKGTSALISTSDDPATQSMLKLQVAQHGALTIPRVPREQREGQQRDEQRPYPTSPMGAYTLVRQALYDAQWYTAAQAAADKEPTLPRPERNDAMEALQQQLAAKIPFIIDASDELYALRVANIAKEFDLNAIIRGGGKEYRLIDAIAANRIPVIVPVNFPRSPNVASPEAALAVSLEDLMDWDLAVENPARLDQAGVKIALCTQGLRDKAGFLAAVRKAVVRGLSKPAAIRAMTISSAELLGVSDRLGTLDNGKLASFIITDGDLFEEKTKVLETWVEGKRHEVVSMPWFDPRGTWKATLQTGEDRRDANITIRGEIEKMSGRIRFEGDLPPATGPSTQPATQPSRETDLSNISIRGARLSFTFKSDALQRPGIAQLSATIGTSEKPGDNWLGSGVWPDGTGFVVTALKTGEPSKEDTSIVQDRASDDGAELAADSPRSRRRGERSATTRPVIKEALYAVNHPLGEFGRAAPPPQPSLVIFTNATVWTAGPEGAIENATVTVRDGKIISISKVSAPVPDGAVIIDCTGKHISPGIIDCHSHMATDSGINESGQAVSAEVRIGDFINPDDINVYRQLAGGVTAANILHGSANPIGGQNQVIKLRWGALPEEMKFKDAPQGIKFALGENVKQSNWEIPNDRRTRYPQTRMGVEQIIRDEFKAAEDYKRRWDEWSSAQKGIPPRRDLELDAIVEILDGSRLIHCHSYRQDEILAFMRLCEQFGVRIATLQHILEGYKIAEVMAKHGAAGSSFSDWWAYKMEVYDAIPYNGAIMHNAGVVVSFNSDDAELARRLNLEAAKAVKYGGIKPDEALKFVTLNPAKQLGIDKWVGSIEVGKDADLAIWNASPLSVYSRVEQTWIDGRKYFDREEDAKARQQVAQMRTALVQRILQSGESPAGPDENEDRARVLWPNEDVFCGCNESKN